MQGNDLDTRGRNLTESLHLIVLRALGEGVWLCLSPAGEKVVLKLGSGASPRAVEFLRKLPHLYTPFRYPRILAAELGNYLLYAYIPGEPWSRGQFETPAALAQVYELAGRLTALFRSLNLVSMYQVMTGRGHELELAGEAVGGRQALFPRGLPAGGLEQRRGEAMQSYAWAQELVQQARERLWGEVPGELWTALLEKVEKTTSIHLAPGGTLLAHTSFTPEHILGCPDGEVAVVSWQTAPRPYNYMRLTYLAWCLVHSRADNLLPRFQEYLAEVPAVGYTRAAGLSFACALLETWMTAKGEVLEREAKQAAMTAFLEAALES